MQLIHIENRLRAASLGLLLALPALAPTQQAEKGSQETAAQISITNFGKVDDSYYRGGQPRGAQYAELAALGVRTVVDLREDYERDEQKLVEQAGMTYRRIPLSDKRKPTPEEVETFLGIVSDSTSGPVYVHCKAGRHRAGAMTALYRMTKYDWTADQAYKEMQKYRFDSALGFLRDRKELKSFVYEYYGELQKAGGAGGSG